MCPDSPRVHQQSHEGTGQRWLRRVQRTAAGTGPQPSFHGAWVLELIPPVRSALMQPESHGEAERGEGARARTRTGLPYPRHVKLSPMSALGPAGERQEHLDATVSFAGAG